MKPSQILAIAIGCCTWLSVVYMMTDCNKHADTELTRRQAIVKGTNVFDGPDMFGRVRY